MCEVHQECILVRRPVARPIRALATMAALALALTSAACGLKGSLDLPPNSEPPPRTQLDGQSATPAAAPDAEATRPATTPRKRIFLDWLLD